MYDNTLKYISLSIISNGIFLSVSKKYFIIPQGPNNNEKNIHIDLSGIKKYANKEEAINTTSELFILVVTTDKGITAEAIPNKKSVLNFKKVEE